MQQRCYTVENKNRYGVYRGYPFAMTCITDPSPIVRFPARFAEKERGVPMVR